MVQLICQQCHRQNSYTVKDFVGHFFICRLCRAANLLIAGGDAVAPILTAPPHVAPQKAEPAKTA